jgi:hypothetical protein
LDNYFNYFTEVEEYFVRKRGKNLLVSPLDWCLIELWRDSGIPLHIVLRGIERSFESAQSKQKRSPKTLFYCHPAILEAFDEYNQAMIGASQESREEGTTPEGDPSQVEAVLNFLQELEQALKAHPSEVAQRFSERVAALRAEVSSSDSVDYRELDRDLAQTGVALSESLQKEMGSEKLKELRAEVKQEMKIYRKRLAKEMYQRLEKNYLDRNILSLHGLPEFSLLGVERA